MIRMSKLTDYGIVLMTELAREAANESCSARELALETRLPFPMVSKILKVLARGGLLTSQRGANGGYSLSRVPQQISIGEVIQVMEGSIAMTECVDTPGDCRQEPRCAVRHNWAKINRAVRSVLDAITLEDMLDPLPERLVTLSGVQLDLSDSTTSGSVGQLRSQEARREKFFANVRE